jgi:isopentenyldiphosphate isomerase
MNLDIKDKKILNQIENFAKRLPRFQDGRIDYSNSDIAPVVTIFIKYKEEILILKRSNKVRNYHEKWNTVAGYIDEFKSIKEKIIEELYEEIKLKKENIKSQKIGESFKYKDKQINKTWIVFPALVILKKKPDIILDWEHTEYKWIKPEELEKYEIVPKIEKSLKNVLK